jgi:hypothetical protein
MIHICRQKEPLMLDTSLLPTTQSPPNVPAQQPMQNLSSVMFLQEVVSNPNIPHYFRMDAAKYLLKFYPHLAYPPSCVVQIPDMDL